MPHLGNRVYHHSTESDDKCHICNKHFKTYWKDAAELNGFSDTISFQDEEKVHFFCIPGAKSLQELNEERKTIKN